MFLETMEILLQAFATRLSSCQEAGGVLYRVRSWKGLGRWQKSLIIIARARVEREFLYRPDFRHWLMRYRADKRFGAFVDLGAFAASRPRKDGDQGRDLSSKAVN
jgi:hypothetical protein